MAVIILTSFKSPNFILAPDYEFEDGNKQDFEWDHRNSPRWGNTFTEMSGPANPVISISEAKLEVIGDFLCQDQNIKHENLKSIRMDPANFYKQFPKFPQIKHAISYIVHAEEQIAFAVFDLKKYQLTEELSATLSDQSYAMRLFADSSISKVKKESECSEIKNDKIAQMIKNIETLLESSDSFIAKVNTQSGGTCKTIEIKANAELENALKALVDTKETNKYKYCKNFQKKFGSAFYSFLLEECDIKLSSESRDKISWSSLNKYLKGEKEMNVSRDLLNQLLLRFIESCKRSKFNSNKIKDETLKALYKLRISCLKRAVAEVRTALSDGTKLDYLQIKKCWPMVGIRLQLLK